MVYIAIPHACAIEIRYLWDGQRVENTLTFATGDDYDVAALQDIAEKVSQWWYTYLRPLQRTLITLTEVYARALHSPSAPIYTDTTYSGVGGTLSSGSIVPSNVTWAVTFRTNLRGRSFRGRNYIIGMTDAQRAGNLITATHRNNIIAAYSALLVGGAADPDPHIWCIASRYENNAPRDGGIVTPVTAVVATNDTLDSMRRRLPGRGT